VQCSVKPNSSLALVRFETRDEFHPARNLAHQSEKAGCARKWICKTGGLCNLFSCLSNNCMKSVKDPINSLSPRE